LDGYVAVTAKERAEVVLVAPEGDPILAAWQYGAGRSVAWTSDVGGPWSPTWAGSPTTASLWGNVLSWLLPSQESGPLSARIEPRASGAVVIADAGSATSSVRPTRAHLVGPDGSVVDVALPPAGPGHYQAAIDTSVPGAYVAQVIQEQPDGTSLRTEVGWVAPYPAEFRASGLDLEFLKRLAETGGGRVLGSAEEVVRPAERPAEARSPLWPLLVVLAAIGWLVDIAARRFGLAMPPLAVLRRSTVTRTPAVAPASVPPAVVAQGVPAASARLLQRKRARRRQN
jgi:hypothetical protein